MTGTTFAKYIRKKTKTNLNTFSDADILTYANVAKDDIAEQIVANVDENYFDIEMERDLEEGIRDYTFPNDLLKHIRFLSAQLDGSNWVTLLQADDSQFDDVPLNNNTEIKDYYSGRDPEFLITGRGIKILSGDDIEDVTDGLVTVGEIYPEDLVTGDLSSSDDLSIPSSNVTHRLPRQTHKVWATKVVVDYKQSRDKPIPLTEEEQKLELDIERLMNKLEPRNTNRSFMASVPEDNGYNY